MSSSDIYTPGFWEIGAYKNNVRRMQEGIDELDEFTKMVKERAEIEAKYSKMLLIFADKWKNQVESTLNGGIIKTDWLQLLGEANELSKIHANLKDRLADDIMKSTTSYIKENHHTSLLRGPKEIVEIEKSFEKAQKPWKKLYEKMEDKRKVYYKACRGERSAQVNLQNCRADTSISQDGEQKFQERYDKMKAEVQKTRQAYEKSLHDLTGYKDAYMKAMAYTFEQCQETEKKRCTFFIGMMRETQKLYEDLITNNRFVSMHNQLDAQLINSNDHAITSDLHQWSLMNGPDSDGNWPQFEEYSPEMRIIGSKTQPKDPSGVVLTRQIIKSEDIVMQPTVGTANTSTLRHENEKASPKLQSSSDSDTNTFDSRKTETFKYKQQTNNSEWQRNDHHQNRQADSPPLTSTTPDSAKYGDFEEYTTCKQAVVLYDYNPAEADEIQLGKGETIEVLSEPDSLGWCTGKKNGVVGLFPASYVRYV
ncbi:hypothetical protein WR25_16874 [Diploscapter pachys]|uniref:SH3 domain-containing protein n=1 Tax=Diploscapter pachys TaxID=2018661 RepID=A0A2A2LDP6_9BILA|nr:hypothetical protein WR25_16874 [Diploscapter pachys]